MFNGLQDWWRGSPYCCLVHFGLYIGHSTRDPGTDDENYAERSDDGLISMSPVVTDIHITFYTLFSCLTILQFPLYPRILLTSFRFILF